MKKFIAAILSVFLLGGIAFADVQISSGTAATNAGVVTKLNFIGPTVTKSGQTGTVDLRTMTGNQTVTGNETLSGNQTVGGTLSVTGATTLTGAHTEGSQFTTKLITLDPTTPITVNCALGNTFFLTPTQNATLTASNCNGGQPVDLIIKTSGTTQYTLTFSTGFKHSPTTQNTGVTTGKYYMFHYISDGTNIIQQTQSQQPI